MVLECLQGFVLTDCWTAFFFREDSHPLPV
jgi:hypothetical protein